MIGIYNYSKAAWSFVDREVTLEFHLLILWDPLWPCQQCNACNLSTYYFVLWAKSKSWSLWYDDKQNGLFSLTSKINTLRSSTLVWNNSDDDNNKTFFKHSRYVSTILNTSCALKKVNSHNIPMRLVEKVLTMCASVPSSLVVGLGSHL